MAAKQSIQMLQTTRKSINMICLMTNMLYVAKGMQFSLDVNKKNMEGL